MLYEIPRFGLRPFHVHSGGILDIPYGPAIPAKWAQSMRANASKTRVEKPPKLYTDCRVKNRRRRAETHEVFLRG